jgi:hypothetical protein
MDIQKVKQGFSMALAELNGTPPARQMENEKEVAELATVLRPAWDRLREWHSGPIDPRTHRLLHQWQPEKVKVDTRSPELLALAAEVDALDAEYQTARLLWEKCVTEKINRGAPFITTNSFQLVRRTDAKEDAETDRRIETAAALRDKASDKVQAKRARYYSLLKEEQGERRAAALRAQQAEQMEAKQRADEARDKSFAADALKFFGIRA